MLSVEQVNAIWTLLDRVGTDVGEELGATSVRQSEIVDTILRRVAEIDPRWSREQILEAWMHQAIGFIHRTTGRMAAAEKTTPKENVDAWNAIAAAETAHVAAHDGERLPVDAYVDGVMERVLEIGIGRSLGREQLFRAWVMKQIVDLMKEQRELVQVAGLNVGRRAKKPGDLPS
jgi:hypothetical protein